MMKAKILFGPAGSGGAALKNFSDLKQAGVDCVEIEFVHSIWMSKNQAEEIRKFNKKLDLKLSIHAPYYINLNSEEKQKIGASKSRILACCEIADILSANYVVFHPGFYLKKTKQETYHQIKEEVLEMQKIIKEKGWRTNLAPETTGKPSQFGDLDELLNLMKDTGCSICVDFAHLKARYNGKINYREIMAKLEKMKKPFHAHFSGIEFTEKGERRHLPTEEKDIKELFNYLSKSDLHLTIINESPNPLGDALKMKKIWKEY